MVMDLVKTNLDNLTSLWRVGGEQAGNFFSNESYSMSRVNHSEWPNKLWFHDSIDKSLLVELINERSFNGITIPVWGDGLQQTGELLTRYGFELKSELTGMSALLNQVPDHDGVLNTEKVTSREMAVLWSHLFREAFGYQISPLTVEKTMKEVDYYIGKYKETPVGTVVLFQDTPEVAGIHSMGIVPLHRRKGFAADLLLHVLAIAKQKGASCATLQASDMGKELYLKTGFQEDFRIKNFTKN